VEKILLVGNKQAMKKVENNVWAFSSFQNIYVKIYIANNVAGAKNIAKRHKLSIVVIEKEIVVPKTIDLVGFIIRKAGNPFFEVVKGGIDVVKISQIICEKLGDTKQARIVGCG
jgi:hypothetical protein